MDPRKIFYGLPAQSLDLNCNLFMTFLSFAQNSFYDTNAVERNLSFCHKLVPNASVHNIQAVWGCVVHSVYIVQHNAYNAGVWIRGPGTRKQIRDGSSILEFQQWSPKVACLCVNVKLFVYINYITMHCMFLYYIGLEDLIYLRPRLKPWFAPWSDIHTISNVCLLHFMCFVCFDVVVGSFCSW